VQVLLLRCVLQHGARGAVWQHTWARTQSNMYTWSDIHARTPKSVHNHIHTHTHTHTHTHHRPHPSHPHQPACARNLLDCCRRDERTRRVRDTTYSNPYVTRARLHNHCVVLVVLATGTHRLEKKLRRGLSKNCRSTNRRENHQFSFDSLQNVTQAEPICGSIVVRLAFRPPSITSDNRTICYMQANLSLSHTAHTQQLGRS